MKILYNHLIKITILILASLVFFNSCGNENQPQPEEKILVRIGDKTISVREFIRRAEYTVRPVYCKNNYNLDKKIILNSLIAEKLMAIEAGDTNKFITTKQIQTYLRGRKEQDMRQWLYEKEALEKVTLDTTLVAKTYKVAGRKYKINYFSFPDSTLICETFQEIKSGKKSFEGSFKEFTGSDSIPHREVEWSGSESNLILDSLYTKPLLKNQVVGPLRIDKNQFMLIKVQGWIDRPAITQPQSQERWRNVADKYREREAAKLYDEYILKVMKGKRIDFIADTFFKVANLLGPVYFKTEAEKQDLLKQSYWEHKEDTEKFRDLQTKMEVLYQEPLFKVDNQVWTVKDFIDEVAAHPLVFRKSKMKTNEYGQQLQLAIMDLIRDKFLTKVAYKRGYEKINIIQRNEKIWQDNLNYQYYKSRLIPDISADSLAKIPYIQVIEKFMDAPVDSLQKKYSDIIEIDVEAFDKIELTRIDMNVIQQNVPFPQYVPSFPMVTTDHQLEYGRKMNQPKVAR